VRLEVEGRCCGAGPILPMLGLALPEAFVGSVCVEVAGRGPASPGNAELAQVAQGDHQ